MHIGVKRAGDRTQWCNSFLFMVYFICVCVHMYSQAYGGACEDQKRISDPLELQTTESLLKWVLVIKQVQRDLLANEPFLQSLSGTVLL